MVGAGLTDGTVVGGGEMVGAGVTVGEPVGYAVGCERRQSRRGRKQNEKNVALSHTALREFDETKKNTLNVAIVLTSGEIVGAADGPSEARGVGAGETVGANEIVGLDDGGGEMVGFGEMVGAAEIWGRSCVIIF